MNLFSVFEELDKLYESADTAVNPVENELEEGIFDSKATKQKKYAQLIADTFDNKAPSAVAAKIASAAENALMAVADYKDETNVASTAAGVKSFINSVKAALNTVKKNYWSVLEAIISFCKKNDTGTDNNIDELVEFRKKAPRVSDAKALEYLMSLVNEQLNTRLTRVIKRLAQEYGVRESFEEPLTEEADAEEAPKQLVLECSKCGALVIKNEEDVAIDDKTDLANIEDECQFCSETEGYKILGTFTAYDEADEEAEIEIEDDEVEDDEIDVDIVEESLDEPAAESVNKNPEELDDANDENQDVN